MEERELYKDLYAELEKYENRGVSIRLNNQPASPMQIVTACMLKEEGSYMRDYVLNPEGNIESLAFINIGLQNHARPAKPGGKYKQQQAY